MKILIKQEKEVDYQSVFKLITLAFEKIDISDHKEQFLVERLRRSNAFIPELSLIADYRGEIIGHILLTKIKIKNKDKEFDSLALAPVSVLPKYQNKGIGSLLIKNAHRIAKEMNFNSIIILGDPNYYTKFGYTQANNFGIELPFEVPEENCMAIGLTKNGLKNTNGIVEYPTAFYD